MSIHRALCLLFSFALASGAAAQPARRPSGDVESLTIHLGDLDLQQVADAREALRRIRFAARDACGSSPSLRVLDYGAAVEGCVRAAVDDALAALDSPLVSRVAAEEGTGGGELEP